MSLEKVVNHHYFTYFSLEKTIDFWDLPNKIIKNYPCWHFKYPLPKLSTEWLSLIKHSLFYYFLKNLQWCLSEVQGHWIVVHSHAMKQAYSKMVISHVEDFDLKLLILIRTISFFISETIHQILIDSELQNDIYQLIVHNLLGITVQPYAYRALLKIYKTNPPHKHQRHSQDDDLMIECQSSLQTKTKGWNIASRRHAKRQTVDKILQVARNHSNIEEMKSIIKQNLYVQPILRASTPKYNINQLRQIDDGSNCERSLKLRQFVDQKDKKQEYKRKKQAIMSNQLSNAFEFNSNLKLKDVKTFAIQRSKPRLSPIRKTVCAKTKNQNQAKVEMKCQNNKQKKQTKYFGKGTKNWSQIVSNMKLQLYTGKHKIQNNKHRRTPNYDDQYDIAKIRSKKNIINKQNNINLLANNIESVKFRKIDILNSQNIKILQQKMREHPNEQIVPLVTKNYSLFMEIQNDLFGISNLQQKSKATNVFIRNTAMY